MAMDIMEIYADRIIILEQQLKKAQYKRQWGKVKQLKWEKERLLQTLKNKESRAINKSEIFSPHG